jgi:hypothetical protein
MKKIIRITWAREHTFMTSAQRGEGGLKICHVFADSIVMKQQIYCSLLLDGGRGGSNFRHFFADVLNVWSPK